MGKVGVLRIYHIRNSPLVHGRAVINGSCCSDLLALAVTGAAGVSAARTIGMPTGTSITAVVMPIFLNGLGGIDYAQARVTGAFHLGNGRHGSLLRG